MVGVSRGQFKGPDLKKEVGRRLDQLLRGNEQALASAAQTATNASQDRFVTRSSGRPTAPPRKGRPTTQGTFGTRLVWVPTEVNGQGRVKFLYEQLESRAPYWLIQEIGTGNSARILDQGRTVSIKSQFGREIRPTLSFADATGSYQAPDKSRRGEDQIVRLKDAKNVPIMPRRRITIGKEIKPKGYVRHGGKVGLSQYRKDLRRLLKDAFGD